MASMRGRFVDSDGSTTLAERPTFAQFVDVGRPHTLLTENTRFSGSLLYRYDDTGELNTVPNAWYNQTAQTRAAYTRFQAKNADDFAAQMLKCPPLGMTQAAATQIAGRYRARAAQIRSEADRIERLSVPSHPVAAGRTQLDYGPNVQ